MHFLEKLPRFLFFTGKGGSGKTSLACATAVRLADSGQRVLLVSTDPASNVGQVLGLEIGSMVTPLPTVAGLSALEIDPQISARAYRERIMETLRGQLPDEQLHSLSEQLSGACTTEIATFDEFTILLTDPSLAQDYDHIVFDTAPTGHTIRLLQLPGAWSKYLEDGRGTASCLGPLAGLEKQRSKYRAAVDALADPLQTRMILVAQAQPSSLREVARTHAELSALGMQQQFLVVNAVLPSQAAADDELAGAILAREQAALAGMPEQIAALKTDLVHLRPYNILGLTALRGLLDPGGQALTLSPSELPQLEAPSLAGLTDEIAKSGHGLIMLMGKGGVGKTTLAAAIAVELAGRGLPVHLSTSDPAAHLEETLIGELENLTISRIDPQLESERYRQHVLDSKGRGLDREARALLEEDLRSPCTDEIAVFQAFARIISKAGRGFVVLDTAPTGHTLRLVDTTGSYHREITRQMESTGMQIKTPLMQLQDPARTKVLIVTLAESTPVLEAEGLQEDLRRAGIEPWAWIVNQSLAAARPRSVLLRQRAGNEAAQISSVASLSGGHYAVLPLQAEYPVGVAGLRKLLNPAMKVQHG